MRIPARSLYISTIQTGVPAMAQTFTLSVSIK